MPDRYSLVNLAEIEDAAQLRRLELVEVEEVARRQGFPAADQRGAA